MEIFSVGMLRCDRNFAALIKQIPNSDRGDAVSALQQTSFSD
jgi:hypothetical protein